MNTPLTVEAADDVRVGPRHPCRSSPLMPCLVRPSFQPQRAIAHNVSRRGIALYLPRELPVGARLALFARGARPGESWVLTARVAYATCHGGGWLIGCELSRPLSDAELAALV
ncbi:MAG TPA: PilZ domain-containing protein [Gemmataceae bacterium]|nr:PilZ domain-containing protein [Gemmataceae bacterium]